MNKEHKLINRLNELNYPASIQNKIKKIADTNLSLNTPKKKFILIEYRTLMEEFLKDSKKIIEQKFGLLVDDRFALRWDQPKSIRTYFRKSSILTESELKFIQFYYSILSDVAAHSVKSYINVEEAYFMFWYLIDLITHRIQSPFKTNFELPSLKDRNILASFLKDIRNKNIKVDNINNKWGNISFNQDQLRDLRDFLSEHDADNLLDLIKNKNIRGKIRNICSSLILSPNIINNNPELKIKLIKELSSYCKSIDPHDKKQLPVFRGISMALNNRAFDTECIFKYIKAIDRDKYTLAKGLELSEIYYGSTEKTIIDYKKRLCNRHKPVEQCIWEIFYLSKQATDSETISILYNLKNNSEDDAIIEFCKKAIDSVNYNRKKHYKR